MRNPRKPVAALILLGYLCAWVILVGSASAAITGLPGWAQLLFYIIAGTVWILPLRPILRWMNGAEPPPED